tara:strand:- start:29114 stop:29542 length:429 start_codon:yes stop_codon:yes gene_type:complete
MLFGTQNNQQKDEDNVNIVNGNIWKTVIETTLDVYYDTIKVSDIKSMQLREGLDKAGFYFLTLAAGFDVEIIKVFQVLDNGILVVERGQQGTAPCIWPAGTVIESRIAARTIDDLRLDASNLLASSNETSIAPNGDIITKSL